MFCSALRAAIGSRQELKTILTALLLISYLQGAELRVYSSADLRNTIALVWSSDGKPVAKVIELTMIQEGQIGRQTFKDLKPGKYRIALLTMDPFRTEVIVETHLTLKEGGSETAILIPQELGKVELPEEVEYALNKFADASAMELVVRYPGFEKEFCQVRTDNQPKWPFRSHIHYLRPDGEYTLRFWNKDPTKGVVYSKSFRTGKEAKANKAEIATPSKPSN